MYSTGTVTTTANSTKLVGTGTKWLNNINRVSAEQAIQVQIGNAVHNNSIQSIQSDTELTLNFPFPTAAKDAKYVILTTMVHSVSDAMNKIVAMNQANVQASDMQNRIMTENGVIDIPLPDGTVRKTRTENEKDRLLDGKFDKTGGDINGSLTTTGRVTSGKGGVQLGLNTYGDVPDLLSKRNGATYHHSHKLPDASGTLMQVGDYGLGAAISLGGGGGDGGECRFVSYSDANLASGAGYPSIGAGIQSSYRADRRATLYIDTSGRVLSRFSLEKGIDNKTAWNEHYTTKNTTKDSNGNLKAASPIIKVFADNIDVNDESEGVTLKKLHTGIYQLCGVLGMHSDASWGGINGGITIPSGINQLPLIYVDYDVLVAGERHPFNGEIIQQDEHGDIVIYTSYRKHLDLPQNVQYARLKTYPEFAREIDGKLVELEAGEPIDIPNGHWIDVRVNMPSNSLYNQKQAEAERLAKIEAERLAKEEAEHLAEEEERAEQYGLGENNALL
ncbi:phage tail fiber protein [Providencia heimbachae]|uniref:phage tail fiber protein n=1 Tax=Providencia heimbachae TaxID=333962 RepID=UPI0022400DE8|nr:hypothetical protein [Providencia heimbachae]